MPSLDIYYICSLSIYRQRKKQKVWEQKGLLRISIYKVVMTK